MKHYCRECLITLYGQRTFGPGVEGLDSLLTLYIRVVDGKEERSNDPFNYRDRY